MKVLFVTNIVTPYQIDLIVKLNEYCDCEMLFHKKKEIGRNWKLEIPNSIEKKLIYCSSEKTLQEILEANIFDVILIGGYSHAFKKAIVNHSRRKKVPIIAWLEIPNRNLPLALQLKGFYLRVTKALECYSAIVAVGHNAQNFYRKIFSRDNLVFNIPYSINVNRFLDISRIRKAHDEKIVFLFIGQLIKRKNIENLLKAFSLLQKRYNSMNFELLICGNGPLEYLVKRYSDYNVKFIGFIQPERLPEIYKRGDVLILPSLDDGWGVVVNEAMASAMPVIGSRYVEAAKEYIVSGKNGFIVDTSADSIYNAMKFYVENPDKIFAHGLLNREIILRSKGNAELASKSFIEIFHILTSN